MVIRDLTKVRNHIFFCNGDACQAAGAAESTKAIRKAIKEAGLDESVHTTKTLCNGRCYDSPVVIVSPGYVWYKEMKAENAAEFVNTVLIRDETLTVKHLHTGYFELENGEKQ